MATYAIASSFSGPKWAQLADRKGQRYAITRGLPTHVVGLLLVVILISIKAPRITWYIAVLLAALSSVQTGSFIRRRWHHVLSNQRKLVHSAWSFESLVDEIIYIIGPVLATVLCTQVAPSAGLLASIVFVSTGAVLLASQTSTEPPAQTPEERANRERVIRIPAVNSIMLAFFFMGGFFGAIEITTVAFATEHGLKPLAGVLLAIWAFGSALAATVTGAIKFKASPATRFVTTLLGLTVLSAMLIFATTMWQLTIALFVSGFAIAPLLVSGFSVVEQEVPDSQITEGIAIVSMGFPIGSAVAATISGRALDLTSAHQAFIIPWLFVALALVSLIPRSRTWRRLAAAGRQLS